MYTTKKISSPLKAKIGLALVLSLYFSSCSEVQVEENLTEDFNNSQIVESAITSQNSTSTILESDFFTDTSNNGVYRDFVSHFGGDSISFDIDDSAKLQAAIDTISNHLGGGRLAISEGNYSFAEINLRSNVHLRISDKAVIKPVAIPNDYAIFRVTNNSSSPPLENVSIIGVGGGKFTVDLRDATNDRVRVIQSWNVKNFKYSNMLVEDNKSKYSAIEFNGVLINNFVNGPRHGVVSNIDVLNAHYGYGVIQLQLGREIYFNNLYGKGGITLRIETHNPTLYDPTKFTAPHNLYGRNIRSENGNCAVMLSPHFVDCGKVDIDDIKSTGSGYGVKVEKGYVTDNEQNNSSTTLTNGSFGSNTIITNVEVTYSDNTAQIKNKDFKYMPCDLRPNQYPYTTELGFTYDTYIYENEASTGGAKDTSNYTINFDANDVTIINPSTSQGREIYIEVDDTINCN